MTILRRQPIWVWGLLGIILLAAIVRLWGITHTVYTDENKVIAPSVQLAQGKQEPLLYPKGFRYPHFYSYVLAITFLPSHLMGAEYPGPATEIDAYTLTSRVVTALSGTLTTLVVFAIGSRLGGVRLGLFAALFFAVLPLHAKYSHYTHVDLPLTLVTSLALYAAVRLWETGRLQWYVITGLLIGLSGATHYTGLVIGAALLLAHGWRYWQSSTKTMGALFSRAFIISLVLIPIGFALASPYTFIEWEDSWETYQQLNKRGAAGDLGYTRPDIWWPLYTVSADWGISFTGAGLIWELHPFLFALVFVGWGVALYRRDFKTAILIGGVALVMYVAIVGQLPLYAVKRLLPLTPLVALLAAYACDVLWRQSPARASLYPTLTLLLVFVITAHNSWDVGGFAVAYAGGSTHSQAVTWAVNNIPLNSVVLQHTPLRLLDWDDARFKPIRLDEVYASFNKDDPEVGHDRAKPLAYWLEEKDVDFIAMDSRLVDRYYDPTSERLYPETTASYRAFYDDIRTRGKQVFLIEPTLWKVAGPRVEIYDVRQLK